MNKNRLSRNKIYLHPLTSVYFKNALNLNRRIKLPEEICYTTYTADEFVAMLKDRKYKEVADVCGLSNPTVSRLAKGKVEEVSIITRAKVTAYLMSDPLGGE